MTIYAVIIIFSVILTGLEVSNRLRMMCRQLDEINEKMGQVVTLLTPPQPPCGSWNWSPPKEEMIDAQS